MMKQAELMGKLVQTMAQAMQKVHEMAGKYLSQSAEKRKRQRPAQVHFAADDETLPQNHHRTSVLNSFKKKLIPSAQVVRQPLDLASQKSKQPSSKVMTLDKPRSRTTEQGIAIPHPTQQFTDNSREFLADARTPDPPKPPITAFFRYNMQFGPKIKQKNPHLSQPEVVQVTGRIWKSLEPELKKPYEQSFARDKIQYEKEREQYYRKYPHMKKEKARR